MPHSDLVGADAACARFAGWQSLDPRRARAHLPSELAADDPSLSPLVVEVSEAMRSSFPQNIFCDLDALTSSLAARPSHLRAEAARKMAAQQHLYGAATSIRFRYVHDFLYGFDWARWVAREPITRREIGPYDDRFLAYLETRGHELLALIAENDPKYPTLPDQRSRSPFPFSREPEAEAAIHRSLAEKDLLPVAAWRRDAQPVWDRPFVQLREAEARALGFWVG